MDEYILDDFGNRMKELRQSTGMTQQQLAEKCGISLPYINLLENSMRKPSLKIVLKIVSALEINIVDFFLPYNVHDGDLSYLLELLSLEKNRDYVKMFIQIIEKSNVD